MDTPIIMLTARDQLNGFDHSTDDYLIKPFEQKKLVARLKCSDQASPFRGRT